MNSKPTNSAMGSSGSTCAATLFLFFLKLFYVLIFLVPLFAHAQAPNVLWKKTLGGTADEFGRAVIRTLDGGSLVVGGANSNNGDVTGVHGLSDFWVVKLDANGNVGWQKAYGGTGYESASGALATTDGGFYIFGSTMSNDGDLTANHGSSDAWILRINSSGAIIWQKTYGGSGSDGVTTGWALADGNLVLSGSTSSNDGDVSGNHGDADFWFLIIDEFGALIMQKCYGGTSMDLSAGMTFSPDGNVIITGTAYSTDGDVTGNPSPWFAGSWTIKINLVGILLWERFEKPEFWAQGAISVASTKAGVVIAGYKSNSVYPDGADLWLVRYDEDGNKLWDKRYGGFAADDAYCIVPMIDGGLIVVGETWETGLDGVSRGWSNFWVLKIGLPGNIIWQKIMGGTAGEEAWGAAVNPDGSIVVVGDAASNDGDVSGNHGLDDIWVVKLDVDPAFPVSLIRFSAQTRDHNSVELKWVTANEVDNAYFEIEKSKDLKDIVPLCRVSPDEQPAATHTYHYTDDMPFQGTSYYRLKQVDIDGKTTTYPWRAVVLSGDYSVYPNPSTTGSFRLRLDEPANAVIQLYDPYGRQVPIQTSRSETGVVEVKLSGKSSPGAYVLQVTERGHVREHRMILD
ncbi:T9SS type A sorting domain-containing protein [Dyadobacter sp. OTU695]|uniref:T9SS type A sorting domain-containing protein n=1 Tax=Dyadobacter sp. OTU695 TaxID=3043860 RepID=UPI00313DE660